jgi:ketosteroid isomerase-like protein
VSEANLETIRRVYEMWNGEEGLSAAAPLFDPDVEYVNPETAIEPGTLHGHAGLIKALDALEAAFVGAPPGSDVGPEVQVWTTGRRPATNCRQ